MVFPVKDTQSEQEIVSILLNVKLRGDLSFSLEVVSPFRGEILVDEVENEVIVLETHGVLLLTEVILQVDMLKSIDVHNEKFLLDLNPLHEQKRVENAFGKFQT